MMFELALDVGEQRRRAEAEQVRLQPVVAELLLYQRQIGQRILGGGDAPGGLVADDMAGHFAIIADGAQHHQCHRQRGVGALLAGGGLDEIGAGHHRHPRGTSDVAQGLQVAGGEDGLHMRGAAGFPAGLHFVVERGPIAGQDVLAGDDDVDLFGAIGDGRLDLLQPRGKRRQACREAGGDGGDRDAGALQGLHCRGDEAVVDADRTGGDRAVGQSERLLQVRSKRVARLGAEPAHAAGGVVAVQRGKVDALDGAHQPGRLPVLFDGAPPGQRRSTAFGGGEVHPHGIDRIERKRHARIPGLRPVGEGRRPMNGIGRLLLDDIHPTNSSPAPDGSHPPAPAPYSGSHTGPMPIIQIGMSICHFTTKPDCWRNRR